MKKIKYYKEFMNTYGDVEVVFDSFRDGRFVYKGKKGVLSVTAKTCNANHVDLDDFTVTLKKTKIRDLELLETVNDIEIDELCVLNNRGIGFITSCPKENNIRITKVTYDDENIFMLSEIVPSIAIRVSNIIFAENDDLNQGLQRCFENIQDKLRTEIEIGRGEQYRIASYTDEKEITNEALQKLVLDYFKGGC